MSMNLASLVAILGSGYAGYVKGNQMDEDRAVQKEREAAERDERAFQMEQRTRDRTLQKNLQGSQKDVTLDAGTTTTGTNIFANPDDAAYDDKENRVNAQKVADNTGTAAVMPEAPKPAFRVGKQMFPDQAGAQQAMMGVNSESARMERAAKVYAEAGKIDEAKKYQDFAKGAIAEGSDKLLSAIQSAAPTIDTLKKAPGGIVAGMVGQDNADIFNKTGGKWKVSPDTKVEYYLEKDAAGRDTVNARVLGKDGAAVVDNVKGAQLMLADMKTRLEAQKNDMTVFQKGTEITEVGRHNQAAEKTAARTADASMVSAQASAQNAATHAKSLSLQQDQFKKQSLEGQITQLEAVTGPLKPEERKALGLKLAGLGKDGETYSKFVDGLVNEGVKVGTVKVEDAMKVRDKLLQGKAVADQEAIIAADLGSSANDPVSYAEKYQKALKITPPARLIEMGYKPPVAAKTVTAPPAAAGINPQPDAMKNWVQQKLIGPLDGPAKYQEIAQSHPNPAVRKAASELYADYQARAQAQ